MLSAAHGSNQRWVRYMPVMQLSDISLFYECHGSGPPLLFIHGLGSSCRDCDRAGMMSDRPSQCGRADICQRRFFVFSFRRDMIRFL
ncbi:MAG: hypothetical protein A2521_07775 [Deltaproteobacteria bacterium RIFOXYD12_FULL_57_12]|nr:MAG: hypothetical protein A2521_07775 [Deltaproteobacteria bacterium RIFOXYD12_FULL_57_12]